MKRFVILTGLSGAGKTTALHAFEDIGFFTSDNVPPSLWVSLVEQAEQAGFNAVCMSVDVRTRAFLQDIEQIIGLLNARGFNSEVVFLDASDDVLVKRYNLTRRTHPLGHAPLSTDIQQERKELGNLRALADTVLDTSRMSAKTLIKTLWERFGPERRFTLRLLSFGFKRGVPIDADTTIDLRALPNPYYDPVLRPLDGRDEAVQAYVFTPEALEFFSMMREFVRRLTEMAQGSGRSSYTVAVGCTGGQHRSVAVAERLAYDLADAFAVTVEHRDVADALQEHLEPADDA